MVSEWHIPFKKYERKQGKNEMHRWNRIVNWRVFCVYLFLVSSFQKVEGKDVTNAVRLVDRPALSPDGGKIAFAWSGEIWTASIDGGRLTRLTNNPANDSQPLFSPDGERIAFVSTRTGSPQIFVMQSDGALPKHAITVPRGGSQGYPHDRIVYASWAKPIIVLCNQNSYSNAEIFSHAVKSLKRGKVVGVQTAGGVVSTGSAGVNDVGRLRTPFRGWFLPDSGQDMELNGCVPDAIVWPKPTELPMGIDRQLDKAVELLLLEVGQGTPTKELIYATQRAAK